MLYVLDGLLELAGKGLDGLGLYRWIKVLNLRYFEALRLKMSSSFSTCS